MSTDPREQALQTAYQIVSEHFPNVVMVAEAQFNNAEGQAQFAQLLRWYGCSTTATGLMVYASDLLCHTFGDRPPKPQTPANTAAITPQQEDALKRALEILSSQFICAVVVAQGEPELAGKGERSLKVIRCNGAPTMVAGLSQFAANAFRRMAVE
ncbi:MAG: hypothetical protein ACFUZC_05645 [Chthoniobacteraceae bacterium]